jgi:hypothetical protein
VVVQKSKGFRKQAEKDKCKWSEKVMAEGIKVKTNVSIGRNSERDQYSKLVIMMMICYN